MSDDETDYILHVGAVMEKLEAAAAAVDAAGVPAGAMDSILAPRGQDPAGRWREWRDRLRTSRTLFQRLLGVVRPDLVAWVLFERLTEGDDPPPAVVTAARDAIAEAEGGRPEHVDAADVAALAVPLHGRLKEARRFLGMDAPPPEDALTQEAPGGGLLWLDDLAAAFLLVERDNRREPGREAAGTAEDLRTVAARRWEERPGGKVLALPGTSDWTPAALWVLWLPRPEDTEAPSPMQAPTRFCRLLASVVWKDAVGPRRRLKAPSLPIWLSGTIVNASRATEIKNEDRSLVIVGEDWRRVMPATLDVVARTILQENARRALVALVAYLVTEAHRRYVANEDRWDYVPIPAARNVLEEKLGVKLTEEDIDAALEWLASSRARDWPFVAGYSRQTVKDGRRGRPEKRRIVHVGLPLAPHGIERVYQDAGVELPPELRWYSPVLEPAHAPLVGDHRTFERQRGAFAFGLGTILTDRREQYADRGVEAEDLRGPLSDFGLDSGLIDRVLDAWQQKPRRRQPGGPTQPVLVETEPGSRLLRLGPDFKDADRMIVAAAERSAQKRFAQSRRRKDK